MTPRAWLFGLDLPSDAIARLAGLLDPRELARADAFRHPVHRNSFIARRGQRRCILGQILCRAPAALRFADGRHGKPSLMESGLQFSVSSAGAIGLCVVADVAIGCDIVADDPTIPALDIARGLFTTAEYQTLEALPEAARSATFLTIWARKEAVVKAIGTGLEQPLDGFEVGMVVESPAEVSVSGVRWRVANLSAPPGFTAALCRPTAGAGAALPEPALFTFQP